SLDGPLPAPRRPLRTTRRHPPRLHHSRRRPHLHEADQAVVL
ncbi:MAG: hypothetical protein AVDCRST_MAG93-2034, partial [uncultured Chloroflexia bacterium]